MGGEKKKSMEIKKEVSGGEHRVRGRTQELGRVRMFKYPQDYSESVWWPDVPDVLRQFEFLRKFFILFNR